MAKREKAAWAAGKLQEPKAGALCYMMSRQADLGGGPWHSHIMFYLPHDTPASRGANRPDGLIFASASDHSAVFYLVVPFWSYGTPEAGVK